MADLESRLEEAGARWRASVPPPAPVGAWLFRRHPGRTSGLWSFLAGAASLGAALLLAAMLAEGFGIRFGASAPSPTVSPYLPTGLTGCPLTKPDPTFISPDGYQPPAGNAWYGSAFLYTALPLDGLVWRGLESTELGLDKKTFWLRRGYSSGQEPRPEIYVTGSRLDGPGRLGFGPGTNAGTEFGAAMLVGIEFPEAGCWRLTAHYGNNALPVVVWVGD